MCLALARLGSREIAEEALGRYLAADLGALLGQRPASVGEGHAALLALIEAEDPARDADLVHYLFRHTTRGEALMAGALGAGEGATLQPVR